MKNQVKRTMIIFVVCSFLLGVPVNTSLAKTSGKQNAQKTALLNRIDFGNSYIMGQSIKSGAVYLLQRKKSDINSMLQYRTQYRDEILEDFQVKEALKNQNIGLKKP